MELFSVGYRFRSGFSGRYLDDVMFVAAEKDDVSDAKKQVIEKAKSWNQSEIEISSVRKVEIEGYEIEVRKVDKK